MIRILQVVTKMDMGGIESMLMNYYRNIDRTQFQFDFLVHREERGIFDDEIESLGGIIYRAPAISIRNLTNYCDYLRRFFKSNKQYRIVHAHLNETSTIILAIAKFYNVPVRIAHSHTTGHKVDKKLVFRLISKKLLLKQSNYQMACSTDAANWLFDCKKSEIWILKNGIDVNLMKYSKDKSEKIKNDYHLNDKFIIGHIGRFEKMKNHEFLIDVFVQIKKNISNSVLILVGDGIEKEKIESKVQQLGLMNDVIFLGIRKDINDLLLIFDVYLFPSIYEGLGLSVIEAQASGLPCIVSDTLPKDVKATEFLKFMSLMDTPLNWAEEVCSFYKWRLRKDMIIEITQNGYNILENVKELERKYVELYEKRAAK